ncbi:unnamed protein product [Oikopleura dioica]|uniref:Translocon-associated protein subunit gamma n=1 Tax=Oikopleura dioica TaxID=34765 RepID=E4YQ00_OIKDI|nr:unnamed protein product [Oikopleura dioica]CBY37554.1 unnamed protein product [Oikopleura dioica]
MARGQKKNIGFSEKELELLRNFSPNTSSKGMAVFWIHALYVVIVPIWIQARVHQYPVGEQMIYLVLGTLLQAFALQFAYKNVKNVQKEKIALQRTEAVSAEVTAQVGTKVARQELEDRILWRKGEVAENESIHFSILYNNCIYLGLYLLFSVIFFKNWAPLTNYTFSIIVAAGAVAGISRTK